VEECPGRDAFRRPSAEVAMLPCLLVCAAISTGQVSPPATDTTPAAVPAPATPERWLLMKTLQGTWPGWCLDSERLQVSGWTDMSFTGSSDHVSNLPLGFNYRANEFLLEQNWIRFEQRVITENTTQPTFGFRTDWILPGSDYRFTLPRGIFNSQLTADNGEPALYGIDPIDFYAEANFPTVARGLDVKVGRFFALFGIESNAAVDNVLLSHTYTFIYDPFTHTGALATLNLTPAWTVQACVCTGCDLFFGPEVNPTFLGSIKWAPPGGRDSALFNVILGKGRFDQQHNFHNPQVFDLTYVHKINSRLTYSCEGLFGYTDSVPDIGTAYWAGIINYLTFDLTPRLSATTRLEFFDDAQGQRTGFRGLYTSLTTGLNFRPRKDIIIRPELRYDDNTESRPFEDRHGLFTAACDVIVRW
jgi:hypothetical protein